MRFIIAKIYLFINMLGFSVLGMDYKQLFCIRVLKDEVQADSTQKGIFKLSVLMA